MFVRLNICYIENIMSKIYNYTDSTPGLRQLSGSKTVFKKQLIRFGEWIDPVWPEDVMRIDRVFLEQLVKNYNNGIPGRIPVPLTHTDNPEYNTGELIELTIEGDGTSIEDGLYGVLEIRREETADDIRNELIFDVSISFATNYTDNENGAQYGPTLLHVALVNNPYIKKMGGFTSLSEELKKFFGADMQVRSLSESAIKKEIKMTRVKNEREFAVSVTHKDGDTDVTTELQPGAELELSEEQVEAVQKQLSEAEVPAEAPAGGEDAPEGGEDDTNLSESDKELRQAKRDLAEANAKLRATEVDQFYTTSRDAGKIVPAVEAEFRALAEGIHGHVRNLSDGTTQNLSEVFATFIEKMPKVVSLNEENGTNKPDDSPVSKLSEETKQVLAKQRITPEQYAKFGAQESVSINELSKKES